MSDRSYTEGELVQWLENTGITPRPDYVDDLLAQTARARRRSAWRFPERWLPMDLTARAPTITGRQVPFRLIGIVALLVLAVAVGAALFVGSQRRLPAPFGPAANGLIVYAAPTDPAWMDKSDYQRPIGDITIVDPVTGASSTLVGGPTGRLPGRVAGWDPRGFRPRGRTRSAALRRGHRGRRTAAADDEPFPEIQGAAWSPNGESIAFTAVDGDLSSLWMARADGTDAHRVDLGPDLSVAMPYWRPPNGEELCSSVRRTLPPTFCPHSAIAISLARSRNRPGWRLACTSSVRKAASYGRSRRPADRTTTTVLSAGHRRAIGS